MKRAQRDDTVTVTFTGELADGEIFESCEESAPLTFQIGADNVISGFQKAIIGMAVGEKKTAIVLPEEAYGSRDSELTHTVNRKVFGEKTDPQPGMILSITVDRNGAKHKVPVQVTGVEGDTVKIDFNHPLAGKVLTYHINLKAILEEGPIPV